MGQGLGALRNVQIIDLSIPISCTTAEPEPPQIDYTLRTNDIVLLMTGADKHVYKEDYFTAHPGMGREATLWLLDQGVKVIGIDGWGFDRHAHAMLSDYLRTGDNAAIFPAHMV